MEVVHVRVDDPNVGASARQHDAASRLVLSVPVHPGTVEDDMVRAAVLRMGNEIVDHRGGSSSCDLQTEESVMVCTVGKNDRATADRVSSYFGQYIPDGRAAEAGSSRQGRNSRVTGNHPSALCG